MELLDAALLESLLLSYSAVPQRGAVVKSLSVHRMVWMSWVGRVVLVESLLSLDSLVGRVRDGLSGKGWVVEWILCRVSL